MTGDYAPNNTLHHGQYIGPATGLKGCTALISDNGEFWAVQVDYHPQGLMVYGWWKCLKEDWEIII